MKIGEEYRKAESALMEARRRVRSQFDTSILVNQKKMDDARTRYHKLRESKEQTFREMLSTEEAVNPGHGLREAEEKVQALLAAESKWKEELNRLEIANKQDATVSVKIQFVREEIEELRSLLVEVGRRLEQLNYESKGEARITKLYEKARPPVMPISDSRKKLMAALPVGLLGLLIGLGIVVEFRSGRVAHPDELASLMPIEVFSIPPLPIRRSDRKGPNQADLIEVFAQRLDHLRVALGIDSVTTTQGARCVMITSAAGGEGKTTLSAQLAGRWPAPESGPC